MCAFMSKRERQRASRRRARADKSKRNRRAEARANLLYDPSTAPNRAAAILRETFGDGPVEPLVASRLAVEGGMPRARAIAEAALSAGHGPMALSLAADVALLDRRPAEAERYAAHALELADDPDLHVRLAAARADQGRLADALHVMDTQLGANPGLEELLLIRGDLLEAVQARVDAAPADCPCGSGEPYERCCLPAERRALERFRDRGTLDELLRSAAAFVDAGAEGREALAAGVAEWLETEAITEAEVPDPMRATGAEGMLRMVVEWSEMMPMTAGGMLFDAFAESAAGPEERRRALDWSGWAVWGLWEVGRPSAAPGVPVTDLVSGIRLYAEIPRQVLDGLPRWSVLVGYFAPVDGVWRAGGHFEVASPAEGRELVHGLVDLMLGGEDEPAPDADVTLLAWCQRLHDDLGPLWMPGPGTQPPRKAYERLMPLVRAAAPTVLAALREMRQPPEDGDRDAGWARIAVEDPAAALEALAERPDFEADLELSEVRWLELPGRRLRATVSLVEAEAFAFMDEQELEVELASTADAADLTQLLDLMRRLGHEAQAVDEPAEDERPEPPVAVPDLSAEELTAWLRAWPDEPLWVLDDLSARQALERHHAEDEVEMLIRYLEHSADVAGVALGTEGLREELGLVGEDEEASG